MPSATLLPEQKTIIRSAIGHDCQIFVASVARLYYNTGQNLAQSEWKYAFTAAVAFMKDTRYMLPDTAYLLHNGRRMNAFFIRAVDLQLARVVWEQELHRDFTQSYRQERGWCHTFSGDQCNWALSFADENEAISFYSKVMNRENLRISSASSPAARPSNASSTAKSAAAKSTSVAPGGKRKIDKSAIGKPSNFRHLTHVGYSAESGFSMVNVPPEWSRVFEKAGVTEEQLKDQNTAKFIYDFMSQYKDADAAEAALSAQSQPAPPPVPAQRQESQPTRIAPPPVPPPSRTVAPVAEQQGRAAPPPPPSRRAAPEPSPQQQPPPPPQRDTPAVPVAKQQQQPAQRIQPAVAVASPPQPPSIGVPPPPPAAPPVPVFEAAAPIARPSGGAKSLPPPADGRNALLDAIKAGGKLKKVEDREVGSKSSQEDLSGGGGGDIAGALKLALMSRQQAMGGSGVHDEDESDANAEDDDDW